MNREWSLIELYGGFDDPAFAAEIEGKVMDIWRSKMEVRQEEAAAPAPAVAESEPMTPAPKVRSRVNLDVDVDD